VAKDMRMTTNHLAGDGLHDVAAREIALFLRHPGMENHLQQHVAKLVATIAHVAAPDGTGKLIGFFASVWNDSGEILLHIPRAPGSGIAQGGHDLQQSGNILGRLHPSTLRGFCCQVKSPAITKPALSIPEYDHRLIEVGEAAWMASLVPEFQALGFLMD